MGKALVAAAHRGAQTLVSEPILRLIARKGTGLGPSRCYRPQSRHSARLLGRCVVRFSAPPPRAIGVAAACPHVQGWPGGGGRRAKQLLRLPGCGMTASLWSTPVGPSRVQLCATRRRGGLVLPPLLGTVTATRGGGWRPSGEKQYLPSTARPQGLGCAVLRDGPGGGERERALPPS